MNNIYLDESDKIIDDDISEIINDDQKALKKEQFEELLQGKGEEKTPGKKIEESNEKDDTKIIRKKREQDNEKEETKVTAEKIKQENKTEETKITGVVIGKIISIGEGGKVYVDFHLNPEAKAIEANTVCCFYENDIGLKVALIFQNGDPQYPLIIGPVIHDGNKEPAENINDELAELKEIKPKIAELEVEELKSKGLKPAELKPEDSVPAELRKSELRTAEPRTAEPRALESSVEELRAEELRVDKKVITFTAEEEIVLKCGKASITLTKAGKILIRGKYVLSRSSGVNSIKGGSVQIN